MLRVLAVKEIQANHDTERPWDARRQGDWMPGLTGLHRADLELGRIELGLERQQAALMQYRTDRRAQARQLLASEFLVDPRVPGVALDGVRPRDDHHRSRRVDNAPENLPGDGVLGKDDDLNVPGPAGREDHLDSLEDLVVIRLSDPPAQVAQSRFKLTRNDPRFRHTVYLRVAGANNSIVRDARVFLASPWSRRRLTMGPYSMDLRERVAAAIDEGEGSERQIAKRFRVSVSFVTRLLQRRRDAGTLAPKPHGGGPRPVLGFPEQVRLGC